MKVVLFCGGRGSATIIRALLQHGTVELSLIVNAYDDGLSTGVMRDFIPGMLGPSDFRKNLSHLADDSLKNLLEYRLPAKDSGALAGQLARFSRDNDLQQLAMPMKDWLTQLPPDLSARMRALLVRFFDHIDGTPAPFDFSDCPLGNMVFAGAYLEAGRDFNAAVTALAALVGSRARLLNVSGGENRVLVGLKQDGTFLASEAGIVGPQSASPICGLYLLAQPLTAQETQALAALDVQGKQDFLAARDTVPSLSPEAAQALAQADVILYGPGTQHSSLLPSYRIAAAALMASPAPRKALVVNLDGDNDIQGLGASDLLDLALAHGAPITHILLHDAGRLPLAALTGDNYCGATVSRGVFATPSHPGVHDGAAVACWILNLS